MRRSINTTFNHPVGHVDSLTDAVVGRSDPLESWSEEKGARLPQHQGSDIAASGAAEAAVEAVPKAPRHGTINIMAHGSIDHGRWISREKGDDRVATAAGRMAFPSGAGLLRGSQRPTPSRTRHVRGATSAASDAARDMPARQQQRVTATGNRASHATHGDIAEMSGLDGDHHKNVGGNSGSWPNIRSTEPLPTASGVLPRQLAVPGGLQGRLGDQRGHFERAGRGNVQRRQGRRWGGGRAAGRGASGGGVDAELNNLHPAWRPKQGLVRRPRW